MKRLLLLTTATGQMASATLLGHDDSPIEDLTTGMNTDQLARYLNEDFAQDETQVEVQLLEQPDDEIAAAETTGTA